MRKLFLKAFLLAGMLIAGFGNIVYAKNVPVTDMFPEDFTQECITRVISQGRELKISDLENRPELSNIEGLDAWTAHVVRDDGRALMTLQTDKNANDAIMSIFLTISYDDMDKESSPQSNLIVADDFLSVLAGALGMNTQESGKLFRQNFVEHPTDSIWCPALGKSIVYSIVRNDEWKLYYFMIFATDVNPDEPKAEEAPAVEAPATENNEADEYYEDD